MRVISKEYEGKEKEMKDKQDDLQKMLAESNESCEELEKNMKKMADELERLRGDILNETEEHSNTKQKLKELQKNHDDIVKAYQVNKKETTTEHKKEKESLSKVVSDLEKSLEETKEKSDEERIEVTNHFVSFYCINTAMFKPSGASILLDLPSEEIGIDVYEVLK